MNEEPLRVDARRHGFPLRLVRWVVGVGVALMVLPIAYGLIADGVLRVPWFVLLYLATVPLSWWSRRVGTSVTSHGVVVKGMLRRVEVAREDVVEIDDPGRWETRVHLRRREGEPLLLPYVEPADVPAIRERLAV